MFVLDLGPAYRGYYADNCRTISVDGQPTDNQLKAWQAIVDTLDMVEQTVRPGTSCRQLFQTAQDMLDEYRPCAFFHDLGHAFGLFPHEGPHLNPNWDDTFEEGAVFTAATARHGPEKMNESGLFQERGSKCTGLIGDTRHCQADVP